MTSSRLANVDHLTRNKAHDDATLLKAITVKRQSGHIRRDVTVGTHDDGVGAPLLTNR